MKKILITAKAMNSGGVEVSLLNLLNELKKYNDLDITVLLEKKYGEYLADIPQTIKVKELQYTNELYSYILFPMKDMKKYISKNKLILYYLLKLKYKIYKKLGKNFEDKILLKKVKPETEKYDLVIDFHGYGYFMSKYVSKKIDAKKKVMFIHDEKMEWLQNINSYMNNYNKFYCVSNSVKNKFDKNYPQYADRSDIFYNIIPIEKILELAEEDINIKNDKEKISILTIGRLEYQKGYDLLIKIAKKLKQDEEDFIWYIIGTGSLKNEINQLIIKEHLEKNVIILGMKKNPYPYLKNCDIYVQPSRHEGYGIAIAEARCLNKPIISTDIECIREQIQNNKTGILCSFDEIEFADKIKLLMHCKEKREQLKSDLRNEKFNNDIYIKKLINLIE